MNNCIQPVAEFRRERLLDYGHAVAGVILLGESDRRATHFLRAGVRCHYQDDVPEVRLAAIVVGQCAMVHHLQQQIEDFGMRLFYLVEQYNGMGILDYCLS